MIPEYALETIYLLDHLQSLLVRCPYCMTGRKKGEKEGKAGEPCHPLRED